MIIFQRLATFEGPPEEIAPWALEITEAAERSDPNVVKADFKRAGFVFVGSSNILRNRADKHDVEVHDPSVIGKTDRFVFKFKKPR